MEAKKNPRVYRVDGWMDDPLRGGLVVLYPLIGLLEFQVEDLEKKKRLHEHKK